MCSYESNLGFTVLNQCNDFREDFDPNSKIVVFLDSFSNSIDVHAHLLRNQKIQFIRKPNSLNLLQEQNKLRILSTTEMTNKADSTIDLAGSLGGASFDTSDSDLFILWI